MSKQIAGTLNNIYVLVYVNGNEESPPPVPQTNDAQIVISASVGINANNLVQDVSTIQDALNRA